MRCATQATLLSLDPARVRAGGRGKEPPELTPAAEGDFPLLGNASTTVLRVLVVEDEEELGAALTERLSASGLQVAWVRDGQGAIDALRTRDFAAVLLDLNIPRLHGLKLLHAMRGDPDVGSPPVVVLTGADEEVLARAERQGAFAVLRKPMGARKLAAILRDAVAFTRIRA